MSTTTTRAALTKPASSEKYDVSVVNGNTDRLDALIGAIRCTSTTRPAQPGDGQLARETDTGRLVWWDSSTWKKASSDFDFGTTAQRPTGSLRRVDALYLETDSGQVVRWDGTRWRYLGDRVVVTGTTQRNALTAYDGLSAYRSDTKTTEVYTTTWAEQTNIWPQAFLYQSTVQNTLTGWTIIQFQAETLDTHNGHDLSTNNSRWTCPAGQDGWYEVGGGVTFGANGANPERNSRIIKNGVTQFAGAGVAGNLGGGIVASVTGDKPVQLVAGDYVELQGYSSATWGTAFFTDNSCWMSVKRIR